MPRRRQKSSGADYIWFSMLLIVVFSLITGGVYLLVKLLWFPTRNFDKANTRIVFVMLAIGMILAGLGLLTYQAISTPNDMPISAHLSTNAIGFTGLSIFAYFLAVFLAASYEADLRRPHARTAGSPEPMRTIAVQTRKTLPFEDVTTNMSKQTENSSPSKDDKQVIHEIWRPTVAGGIAGQKIAIVGYSHYVEREGIDHEQVTTGTLRAVICGEQKHSFFTKVRNYFGYGRHDDFWPRVYFFNFIPEAIGDSTAKHNRGTEEMIERGQKRFLGFLEDEQPDKVFVFSKKGWDGFPESLEERAGGVCTSLVAGLKKPNWGTYKAKDKYVRVCGFQHPERANSEELSEQVKLFLEL